MQQQPQRLSSAWQDNKLPISILLLTFGCITIATLLRMATITYTPDIVAQSRADHYDSNRNGLVNCFWLHGNEVRLKCVQPEKPNLQGKSGNSTQIWPTAVVIGSYKTGTSEVEHIISHHKGVTVADVSYGDQFCCNSELYFLTQDQSVTAGLSRYAEFFRPKPSQLAPSLRETAVGGAAAVATGPEQYSEGVPIGASPSVLELAMERTPRYAFDLLAPFRARVFLPPSTRYIYTVRDPVEAQASLYLFRNIAAFNKVCFNEYATIMGHAMAGWMQCRRRSFNAARASNSSGSVHWANIRSMYDPAVFSMESVHALERSLLRQCGESPLEGKRLPFATNDIYFQVYLHAFNLRRWVRAVGRESILCVHNDDVSQHPQLVQQAVGRHLGLSQQGWGDYLPSPSRRSSTLQRLRQSQIDTQQPECVDRLDWAMEYVRQIYANHTTEEDLAFLADLCPRLGPS